MGALFDVLQKTSSDPSVNSATLHCPLTWNGKISEDLIQSAKTKGWTIVYEK